MSVRPEFATGKPVEPDPVLDPRTRPEPAPPSSARPSEGRRGGAALYVDLDGTLVAGDLLWESLWAMVSDQPLAAWRLPFWLLRGRAGFKRELAERVFVDPSHLPYRREVLELVAAARRAGCRVVLTTASDERFARPVAEHLGLFDAVLASDGSSNLAGRAKLAAIEADAGPEGFEYAGNARVDVPIWARARRAWLVAPTRSASRAAERLATPKQVLTPDPPPGRGRALLRALRPHQWVKNVLLFVPLLLAHQFEPPRLLATVVAFLSFCACASGSYILNDLLDLQADRAHPRKRGRPFAAGALSIPAGIALAGALLVGAFGLSLAALPLPASGMLAVYAVLTTAYSLVLKRILLVDVLVLAGLYTHRVLAGAVAAQVAVSPWLLAFSLFIFLSLAFVKRYVELASVEARDESGPARRGYRVGDIGMVQTMGLSSGFLAVLVIGLYVSSDDVRRLYAMPELLWGTCPVLLYWVGRIWFLAGRGSLPDDPVLFAATDRTSYAAGALVAAIAVLASVGVGALG